MEQEYEKQKISFTYIVFLPTVLATEVVQSISMEVLETKMRISFIYATSTDYLLWTRHYILRVQQRRKQSLPAILEFII